MTNTSGRATRQPAADQAEQRQDEGVIVPPAAEGTQDTAEDPAPPAGDDAPEKTEQATAEAVGEPATIEEAVDRWFAGFNDSSLSRHPEFWGLVQGRLPELKAAIGAVPTA